MKSTKKSLIASALSLVLCVTMLLGTTYAWFTDSVTSGRNKIVAGILDVELTHTNATVENDPVQDDTDLFGIDFWEPGVIAWENLTVTNVGNLAFKYALNLNVFDKNATTEGHDLTEVIKVAVIDGGFTATGDPVADRASAQAITTYESLKDFQKTGNLEGGDSTGDTFGVVLYWQPTDNDNLYNVNNGKSVKTSDLGVTAENAGNALFVEFGVNLVATQDTVESDAFDKYYDKNATFPNIPTIGTKATKTETVTEDAKTNGMTIKNDLATLEIPAANIDEDASKYRLDIERIENIEAGQTGAVSLTSDTNTLVTFDVSLIEIKSDNTETKVSSEQAQEYTVTLYVGTHCELIKLYHKGTPIANFTYNAADGKVTYKTKSFSPYAGEIKFAGGEGTEVYPYLLENETQFLGLDDEIKVTTKSGVYFKFIEDMDMSSDSIKDDKKAEWSRACWFKDLSSFSNIKLGLDLNDHSINNLDCFLFAEVHNLEMINGTVNFVNGNNSKDYVPGIIYFCDPTIPVTVSFINLILDGDYDVNMLHYGPVIAQCYGGTNANAAVNSVSCENVVSNVKVWNVAGGAYTGGIFGYVGSVTATIKDSKFNGYIQSALAGGFMNPMKENTLKLNGSGNVMNGSILATNTVQEFGAGDTKNLCTKTENAHLDKVTVSTGLLGTMNMGDEITINHTDDSIKRYAVSIMVWTNHATCTTVFNVNVPAESVGTLNTGLYKNYFENTSVDGSTNETRQNSGWFDGCIWLDGDTYKVYCSDTTQISTTSNATIYVYGYNTDGKLVTYQSQSYSPAK